MKKSLPVSLGIFTLTSLLAISDIHASNQTWIGNGADGSWATNENWSGGAAPGNGSSTSNTDIATFNAAITNGWGTTGTPIIVDANRNLSGLNFDANSGDYVVGTTGGNALKLTSGGSIQLLSTLTTAAKVTIDAPLLLQGKTYSLVSDKSGGSLTIGGAISSNSATTGNVLSLKGATATSNTISGAISDGDSVGGMGITLTGSATWTLSNVNTFSGTTQVGSTATGKIIIANALALQYSTVSVDNGRFGISAGITEVTFGGLSGNSGLYNDSNRMTGFNNLTKLTLNTVAGKTATLGATGYIADNGKNMELVKEGDGTQVFSRVQLYKGKTTINGGRLTLTGAGSLASTIIENHATFHVSGVTSGFALAAGQSLTGSGGRVIGAVSVAKGVLDLGGTVGTMTFDNNLTFTDDSTARFRINVFETDGFSLAAGGTGIQNVTFKGALNITFQSGFATLGSAKIFDFESYDGVFDTMSFNGLAGGFQASFDPTTGVLSVVAIPEPTSGAMGLIGLGLGTYFLRRRNGWTRATF